MARTKTEPGTWCHVEFQTTNIAKAKKFYGSIFGWKFEEMPGGGYTLYATPGGGVGGGICQASTKKLRPAVNYILVDEIEATVKRVTKAGGKLKEAKQEVHGFGWYAVVTDPDGNTVGLWQSAALRGKRK